MAIAVHRPLLVAPAGPFLIAVGLKKRLLLYRYEVAVRTFAEIGDWPLVDTPKQLIFAGPQVRGANWHDRLYVCCFFFSSHPLLDCSASICGHTELIHWAHRLYA